jgi:hypothetical protein
MFSHWYEIQIRAHFLQSLTEIFRIEFPHEEISAHLLALMLKSVSPTTLGIKYAIYQLKNGIIINMLCRHISRSLGQACLVFNILGPSLFHKGIQNASTLHDVCQIYDHLLIACKSIVLDMLIKCCPPLG